MKKVSIYFAVSDFFPYLCPCNLREDVSFSSCRKSVQLKTIRNMLEKTKKTFKEEIGKSPSLTCDPMPAPIMGIVKIVKALKEDIKIETSSRCSNE